MVSATVHRRVDDSLLHTKMHLVGLFMIVGLADYRMSDGPSLKRSPFIQELSFVALVGRSMQ